MENYDKIVKIAMRIAEFGFIIITRGGTGIMEPAYKDDKKVVEEAWGGNILLQHQQVHILYIDIEVNIK